MKLTKDVALMMIGAGAVLMYQKYSKPMMKKMDKALDKADRKLENMIN